MRWRDAALINTKLKAEMESLSRNEILKMRLQILGLVPKEIRYSG
jgi:hypothetical protein